MKNMGNSQKRSCKLTHILRHDKTSPLESGGWLPMRYLIAEQGFTRQEIIDIVASDEKGRYEINESEDKIRALYGHSIKVDLCLLPGTPPPTLYHGTATKYMERILASGIQPKSRQYVHLTTSREVALKTGERHGTPLLITVDAGKMYEEGFCFYPINESLWLSKEIPPQFICISDNLET